MNKIKDTVEKSIVSSSYPVVFTGQGLSCLSGIPTYEDLILEYPIHEILNIEFYLKYNTIFNKFHLELFKWTRFSPNVIHELLAKLDVPVITESIDGLLFKAGHKKLIELNGNLLHLICTSCDYIEFINSTSDHIKELIPSKCPICFGNIKPDIVFRGESLRNFHLASNEIYQADLLLVIGSQLNMWPANKLISKAQKQGCKIVSIDI